MREALHHRGPDDGGTWNSASDEPSPTASNSHALLGNRRLAILDLSPAGHQPMVDPDSGLVIAYNGEIYNYAELAEELASHGAKFRSRGDTEVLLKAYATWGRGCLQHLNGMFAFAIWDPRKREVFCARDRFGEKPFYYYRGNDFLAFASEIKSLVAGRFFTPEPDPAAIYGYLANREMDSTAETLFKNIFSLPAAHALEYSAGTGSLKIWKYWDIDPAKETRLPTDEDYALRFLELLTDSVRIRLRSDVPLGSSLSGGLDSSTVVGLIARLGAAQGQATFSARFADPRFDEGRYIEKVVAHARAAAHEVYPDPTRIAEEIETLTWHQDHPFYSSSIYAQWCVMRLAREAGVTVLLDGQGADETLAGYHEFFSATYRQQLKDLKILQAASSVRRYTADHGTAALSLIFRSLLPAPIKSAATRLARPRAIPREFAARYSRPPRASAPISVTPSNTPFTTPSPRPSSPSSSATPTATPWPSPAKFVCPSSIIASSNFCSPSPLSRKSPVAPRKSCCATPFAVSSPKKFALARTNSASHLLKFPGSRDRFAPGSPRSSRRPNSSNANGPTPAKSTKSGKISSPAAPVCTLRSGAGFPSKCGRAFASLRAPSCFTKTCLQPRSTPQKFRLNPSPPIENPIKMTPPPAQAEWNRSKCAA